MVTKIGLVNVAAVAYGQRQQAEAEDKQARCDDREQAAQDIGPRGGGSCKQRTPPSRQTNNTAGRYTNNRCG